MQRVKSWTEYSVIPLAAMTQDATLALTNSIDSVQNTFLHFKKEKDYF